MYTITYLNRQVTTFPHFCLGVAYTRSGKVNSYVNTR
jgi:hypothetical protein